MIIQQVLRGNLISGLSMGDYMRNKNAYINEQLTELNSNGIRVLRVEDEPTTRGPLGNVYGRVNFVCEADTEDPRFQNFIKADDPQSSVSSSGCYIATCVYGSYDCPAVWTLRRYRDFTLASTSLGRHFIRVYYNISPKLVKWVGHTKWFKTLWKAVLDAMVKKLNAKGFENTPYTDHH